MSDPTPAQITHTQENVHNIRAWVNHLHDYAQDRINDVYLRISEDPNFDPMQKFVTNMLDSVLWSIGAISFPGSGVVSSFLGTFFGSYSGPDTPPSLNGACADVWERFSKTFQQANDDLGIIHDDVKGKWNKKYTNPETGKDGYVYQLGDPSVSVPGEDTELYQQMTDGALTAFTYNMTKQMLGKKWSVIRDLKGVFFTWTESYTIQWIRSTMKLDNFASYMITYQPDEGGSILCPQKGFTILENHLGTGYYSEAPSDLCNWLLKDDGYGDVLHSQAIASRKEVFYNWGLQGSLGANDLTAAQSVVNIDGNIEAEKRKALRWIALFDQTPRQELEKRAILKAKQDIDFRDKLIKEPKETVQDFLGLLIPQMMDFEVIKELQGEYKLVLPLLGRSADVEAMATTGNGLAGKEFKSVILDLENRQQVEQKIIGQSQNDPDFLRMLVKEPVKALTTFLGTTIGPDMKVEVIQETPGKYKMVLPHLVLAEVDGVEPVQLKSEMSIS